MAALLVLPVMGFAQDGTVTAPFVAKAPVIDGKISAGEWDAAGVAQGAWTSHENTTPAAWATNVKVCYSVDAVYFLYECEDPEPQSAVTGSENYNGLDVEGAVNSSFAWGGDTDYVSLYIDPANIADTAPNADEFSYSIQWEPSISAKNEKDSAGNSYNFTECGRWGGFMAKFEPPLTNKAGALLYWGGGVSWQCPGLQIVDGKTTDGYVCEVKLPWTGLSNGYWRRYSEAGIDTGGGYYDMLMNGDATDPLLAEYGSMKAVSNAADGTAAAVGAGIVTGMPAAGTQWKVQFCRYSTGDLGYVNWVGQTGGFVSRPFGNLIFGTATPSQVEDALLQ